MDLQQLINEAWLDRELLKNDTYSDAVRTVIEKVDQGKLRTAVPVGNEWRVNEFIATVSQPVNQQFTLLAVAFDCGFNSKASFNRNFKKLMGVTP